MRTYREAEQQLMRYEIYESLLRGDMSERDIWDSVFSSGLTASDPKYERTSMRRILSALVNKGLAAKAGEDFHILDRSQSTRRRIEKRAERACEFFGFDPGLIGNGYEHPDRRDPDRTESLEINNGRLFTVLEGSSS